mmetsp:Transcript_40665/g.80134  ORF Transcript_40665/g.80134 Transcript_40665/m.80134 type:complete len:100 (+) Transcript_40665:45-344(+)
MLRLFDRTTLRTCRMYDGEIFVRATKKEKEGGSPQTRRSGVSHSQPLTHTQSTRALPSGDVERMLEKTGKARRHSKVDRQRPSLLTQAHTLSRTHAQAV